MVENAGDGLQPLEDDHDAGEHAGDQADAHEGHAH
jgi:hypothetical protein